MKTPRRAQAYVLAALLVLTGLGSAAAQEQSWLEGYWEGRGVQNDGQTWTITLTVKNGIYRVKYPSLACEGVWHVYGRGSKKMKFVERVNGRCLDAGMVTIEKAGDDQLSYGYEAHNTRKTIARATLRRGRPPQPPAPARHPSESDFVQTPDPVHNAGKKLFENDLYAIYRSHPYYMNPRRIVSPDEFCRETFLDSTKREVRVNVVFKVGADRPITDDAEYRRRFESEILPAVRQQCENVAVVYINNYVRGVRINHDGREIPYGQALPEGFKEYPLNHVFAYVEPGGIRYEGYRKDSTSARTYASLSSLRATIAREAAERPARLAEYARQEELQKQERLKRRQEEHRARAREVLTLLKPHAPERHTFTGYASQGTLEQIYHGDFKEFTGGFESVGDATKSADAVLGGDPRNPMGIFAALIATGVEVEDVARRRRSVNTIFYTYHNVYKDQCLSNKEVPWTMSTPYEFFVTRNGVRVEGSEGYGVVIPIRVPYKQTYDAVYSKLAKDAVDVTPEMPESYAGDFRNFLKAEGCASPSVRRFEVNLYLATHWLLPVHELGVPAPEAPKPVPSKPKPDADDPQPPAATKPKPAASKTKQPATAKPKPKPRKKGADKTITPGTDWVKPGAD